MNDRRTLLLLLLAAGTVAACGNRPPRPTTRTVDLRRIGLVPIRERAPGRSESPFNAQTLSLLPARSRAASIGFSSALAEADERAVDLQRRAVARSLSVVQFSPKRTLEDALAAAIAQRKLPLVPLALGEDAATAVLDDWHFEALPPGLDAVLGIEIVGAGYFPSAAAGGYSPALYLQTNLLATTSGGALLESVDYNADHRDAKGDRRFLTTPRGLSVRSPADFASHAEAIRAGMTSLCRSMVDLMVVDLERAIGKQPRLAQSRAGAVPG